MDGEEVLVEVRTENHDGIAFRAEAPWELAHLEGEFAETVRASIQRGSVRLRAEVVATKAGRREGEVARLLNLILRQGLRIRSLRIVQEHQVNQEAAARAARAALQVALSGLAESRSAAGAKLATKVRENVSAVLQQLSAVRQLVAGSPKDVTEELDVIETHAHYAVKLLATGGQVGKALSEECRIMENELKTVTDKWRRPAAEIDGLRKAILRVKEQASNLE